VRYREVFGRELRPVEGVVEALQAIEASSCVASSGSQAKIRFSLGLTGLLEYFRDRIFSFEDVTRGKPTPDLFLRAAKQMDVAPYACAVIEDSPAGLDAALAAGMRAFAYAGGLVPTERLRAEGTVVFDDMRFLPPLLIRAADSEPDRPCH
jgi:HAD superfamily hydrolase (TIGR01509 family)